VRPVREFVGHHHWLATTRIENSLPRTAPSRKSKSMLVSLRSHSQHGRTLTSSSALSSMGAFSSRMAIVTVLPARRARCGRGARGARAEEVLSWAPRTPCPSDTPRSAFRLIVLRNAHTSGTVVSAPAETGAMESYQVYMGLVLLGIWLVYTLALKQPSSSAQRHPKDAGTKREVR
jgi:hypothetical protein